MIGLNEKVTMRGGPMSDLKLRDREIRRYVISAWLQGMIFYGLPVGFLLGAIVAGRHLCR